MISFPPRPLAAWRRGRRLQTARLASGLVLMTFVVTHFLNHMLALISLDTAEAGRHLFIAVWRNPAGTTLLYGAILVHVALVLLALYRRRTLTMPAWEAAQVLLGLLIPLFIVEHVIGTRVYSGLSGVADTYESVANSLWVWAPLIGLRQAVAVIVIWLHGCLGLYFWLRHRYWFSDAFPLLVIVATLIPVLTLLGFVNAGRTVQYMLYTGNEGIDRATIAWAVAMRGHIATIAYITYGTAVGLVLLLRFLRIYRERRSVVRIHYADGRTVRVPPGYSVLEASRIGGIPHNSVCGGRGRCSTCRVKVSKGLENMPEPQGMERATLTRIHAEPGVRLACQLRPGSDITVMPLVAAGQRFTDPAGAGLLTPGREQDAAILFCDIRGFTAISDRKLPFDTVFLLNRYFAVVGKAVEEAGGRLDKFIGDGAMAIFGLNAPREEACRQALIAAAAIIRELAAVSHELANELGQPLRVAIGIHAGRAIVGTMGYGRAMGVTAIGDAVNIASRLETVAKEFDAAIVVSEHAAALSGIDMRGYEMRTVEIRGRAQPLKLRVVPADATLDTTRLLPRPAEAVM